MVPLIQGLLFPLDLFDYQDESLLSLGYIGAVRLGSSLASKGHTGRSNGSNLITASSQASAVLPSSAEGGLQRSRKLTCLLYTFPSSQLGRLQDTMGLTIKLVVASWWIGVLWAFAADLAVRKIDSKAIATMGSNSLFTRWRPVFHVIAPAGWLNVGALSLRPNESDSGCDRKYLLYLSVLIH